MSVETGPTPPPVQTSRTGGCGWPEKPAPRLAGAHRKVSTVPVLTQLPVPALEVPPLDPWRGSGETGRRDTASTRS